MFQKMVGRLREQEILTDALNSHRSELIAIYGRRRIGKTYLVRTFFDKQIIFSFTGLSNGKRSNQIKNFILKLNEVTNNFKGDKQPEDWLEAFSYLKIFIKGMKESKKKIIVTESQYKRLIEQKNTKIEVFQKLIDKSLDYIGQFCNESLSAEDYAGDIGFDSCEFLETIDRIKIDKLEVGQVGGSNSSNELVKPTIFIHLYLTINYHTIGTMTDFDGILYDIKTFLRKKTGVDIIFTYTTHNLNMNKNW